MEYQTSGVYKIICHSNNKYYIGSAIDLNKRKDRHFRDLKNGKHHNLHLQRIYNKYGHDSFEFIIIENCEKDKTIVLEQDYLNKFINDKLCVNMVATATFGDTLSNHPNKKEIIRKRTESYNKMLLSIGEDGRKELCGRHGESNWSTGGNFKESTIKKLTECGKIGADIRAKQVTGKKFEELYGEEKAKEMRNKISEDLKIRMIGKGNNFYGKHHSEKHKQASRKRMLGRYGYNKSKPIIIDGIEYISLKHASDLLHIPSITIRWRVNSKNFDNYNYK